MTKNDKTTMTTDVWVQGNDPKQYTIEEVFAIVEAKKANPETITHIMVGTDSHSYGAHYHFVTVLCV